MSEELKTRKAAPYSLLSFYFIFPLNLYTACQQTGAFKDMEISSDQAASEQELREFLNNCGLEQYADALIAEGFDQLKSVS
jgi:hypothetical protein